MLQTYSPQPHERRLAWASLKGPDAQDFLHRVTTVNVRELSVGEGAPGCILNAQGKIQASFQLWQLDAQEFGFEYDPGKEDHWKKALFAAIDQYTFAEKMTLTDAPTAALWVFGEDLESIAPGLKPGQTTLLASGARACHHGSTEFGRPWMTIWGDTPVKGEACDEATLERWRIEAVKPRVDFEINNAASPLELGMTTSIAPNKGCYPGQEVIEKVISLGSPAKRLVKIEGTGAAPTPGSSVRSPVIEGSEIGTVTSAIAAGQNFIALAVVRKTHAKENLEVSLPHSLKGKISAISSYA